MGLAFGINKPISIVSPKPPLKEVIRHPYHFKLNFDSVFQINELLSRELFGSFSEFVRYSFLNQFQNGLNEELKFNMIFFEDTTNLRRKISLKIQRGLSYEIRSFCKSNNIQYSKFLRYCIAEELTRWRS